MRDGMSKIAGLSEVEVQIEQMSADSTCRFDSPRGAAAVSYAARARQPCRAPSERRRQLITEHQPMNKSVSPRAHMSIGVRRLVGLMVFVGCSARLFAAEPELTGNASAPAEPLSLWYRQPAAKWVEALPVGNGRVGAMAFGGINRERLQLNEDAQLNSELKAQ
jgi:hypothetical protein